MHQHTQKQWFPPVRPRRSAEEQLAIKASREAKLTFEPTIPLDAIRKKKSTITVTFTVGGFGIHNESTFSFFEDGAVKREVIWREAFDLSTAIPKSGWYDATDSFRVHERFVSFASHRWPEVFEEKAYFTMDGTQWNFTVKRHGKLLHQHGGSNAYPSNWKDVIELFGIS